MQENGPPYAWRCQARHVLKPILDSARCWKVAVRISDEKEPGAALAVSVRRAFGLDALRGELGERPVQVLDADRDVAVAAAEVVRATVVVVRQFEHRLLVADREETVRCLALAVADDVHLAGEREPERLVER